MAPEKSHGLCHVIEASILMNQISPRKRHESKWTTLDPQNKEKQFMVVEVLKEEEVTASCVLEVVYSKHPMRIPWRELKNSICWRMGWH